MAAFTFTQTDKVLGTLTNGMKLVETLVTITSVGATTATPITIKPLRRVQTFIAASKTITAGGIVEWAADATVLNVINATPAASANTDVFVVYSFGY